MLQLAIRIPSPQRPDSSLRPLENANLMSSDPLLALRTRCAQPNTENVGRSAQSECCQDRTQDTGTPHTLPSLPASRWPTHTHPARWSTQQGLVGIAAATGSDGRGLARPAARRPKLSTPGSDRGALGLIPLPPGCDLSGGSKWATGSGCCQLGQEMRKMRSLHASR